jgi:DNA repair protein RadA/Sms
MKWACTVCEARERSRVRPAMCGRCGATDCFLPDEQNATSAAAFVAASQVKDDNRPRYATGDKDLDAVLKGGIPAGARVLVWGRGGSGKSRCTLRWSTHIGSTACISLEMAEVDCVRYTREAGGKVSQLRVTRDEQAPLPRVRCIVFDSISEATDPTGALERLKEWAARTGGIVFLICHATKAGEYRGPSTLQHWGEAEFQVSAKGRGLARVRVRKSRFCEQGAAVVPLA